MPGLRAPAVWLLLLSAALPAHFYSEEDPLVSLEQGARALLLNSSSCFLVQFFASWCGHCKAFKPSWLLLAEDVKDWRPAFYLGVLDCAKESNSKTCNEFEVKSYPNLQFFNTFTKSPLDGIKYKRNHEPEQLRHFIIDNLEAQKDNPPPACPPLEPISAPEVRHFFENNDEDYLVLIFEETKSYMGREVALDMLQYQKVSVRRVVKEQSELVEQFKVVSFPSGSLLCRNGSISTVNPSITSRKEYKAFLLSLPGVQRVKTNLIGWSASPVDDTVVRRTVNRSAVYMADLESSIRYSLHIEVSRHSVLYGDRLKALTNYFSVLKKYFPARPRLRTMLDSTYSWLYKRRGSVVAYKDIANIMNNKDQEKDAVLTPHINFVGCQGSETQYRGFPCSVWTLFHFLTVRAKLLQTERSIVLEVLRTMRSYIRNFFGCRYCAGHFEDMARESINSVRSLDDAIRWLWLRHNQVNKRLAGDVTEDPEFPKIQWPSKEQCPDCQKMVGNNVTWDEPAVLCFMKRHFSEENLSFDYLEDEAVLLENQRKGTSSVRTVREAEDEETHLEKQIVSDAIIPAIKAQERGDDATVSKVKPRPRNKPTIIRRKSKTLSQAEKEEEAIVDLDSVRYLPRRTLKNSNGQKNSQDLQPERMLDLPDSEFDQDAVRASLVKRGIDANSLMGVVIENGKGNWKGRWGKMLDVGFSRLDISICVLLYFVTSMCLLVMYLYLSFRSRLRQRCLCPQL